MVLVKVKCAFCGKTFFREKGRYNEAKKHGWRQYCSKSCLSKARTTKRLVVCENCGKTFTREPSKIGAHNYCSRACAAQANNKKSPKRKPRLRVCKNCGKLFKARGKHQIYCSRQCKNEAARKYTRQQLLKIIKETAKTLKRSPTKREMKAIAESCRDSFGSWNNAIIAAGLLPNRSSNQRMYKCTRVKALDGDPCDSISELIIDNWLLRNNIPHRKNESYPGTNLKADWVVFKGKQKVFVEYFGLANDSSRYDRTIKRKEKLCHQHNIRLIAIYPKDIYPRDRLDLNLKNKFRDLINT